MKYLHAVIASVGLIGLTVLWWVVTLVDPSLVDTEVYTDMD